jgi:hypothetical protein
MARRHEANLWILLYRAPDVPDEWIAHCLDMDVVSQGTSFHHAMSMLEEAIVLVMRGDITQGRDPFKRVRAPDEEWVRLHTIQREGGFFPLSEIEEGDGEFAVQLHAWYEDPNRVPDVEKLPPAWVTARRAPSEPAHA